MRHRIAAISVVLVVLIASGVTIALAGSGRASTSITKAQAVAYAHAVNLRAGDVPGLVPTAKGGAVEGPLGTLGVECDVAVRAGKVVGIGSQGFERLQESTRFSKSYLPLEAVSSAVFVMRTPALASREIAVVRDASDNPTVVTCLKHHLENTQLEATDEGGKKIGGPTGKPALSQVEVTALRSPLQAIRAYGLQIRADFEITVPSAKGLSHLYDDFLGFAIGPAVIMLDTTGDPHLSPAATEQRLLSLLHSRAEANKLS
jgi:hypothetical protein